MNKNLTKSQFYQMYVKDYLNPMDKPANRLLWSNSLDFAFDNGFITQHNVNNWNYPKNKFFE